MKKMMCVLVAVILALTGSCALAGTWIVPTNGNSGSSSQESSGVKATLTDDLATRSGPSTSYTGCGSYKMKGQQVTVLSRAFDNGGVQWVEVEFTYNGGYRRAWTGVKRLNISSSKLAQVPEEDPNSYIGYGSVNARVSPRFGPGSLFATYGDRDYSRGDRVVAIKSVNGYYMVESWHTEKDGVQRILRCWIPEGNVNLD